MSRWPRRTRNGGAGHVYVCCVLDSTERFHSEGRARSLEAKHVLGAEGQCIMYVDEAPLVLPRHEAIGVDCVLDSENLIVALRLSDRKVAFSFIARRTAWCPWKRRTSQNEDPSASRSGRSPLPLRSRLGLVLGEELVVAATVGETAPPFGESMGPMSSS